MNFFKSNSHVAEYVADQLRFLKPGSRWTMTITAGKYGDFSARTVTGASSEDTEKNLAAWPYLETRPTT